LNIDKFFFGLSSYHITIDPTKMEPLFNCLGNCKSFFVYALRALCGSSSSFINASSVLIRVHPRPKKFGVLSSEFEVKGDKALFLTLGTLAHFRHSRHFWLRLRRAKFICVPLGFFTFLRTIRVCIPRAYLYNG
jgi:hypothetical protein